MHMIVHVWHTYMYMYIHLFRYVLYIIIMHVYTCRYVCEVYSACESVCVCGITEGSGSGDEEELQQELDDLKEEREREGKGEGEEGEGEEGKEVPEVGGERVVGQREEEETVSDDEPGPSK